MIESSIKNLKAVVEELKNTGVSPIRGQRDMVEAQTPLEVNGAKKEHKEDKPLTGQREQTSNGVKIAETPLSDLIQEKMNLEKVLQEINNLKGKICQRIGLLKILEKGKKEIERAPDFLGETKKKLDNLKEHIK